MSIWTKMIWLSFQRCADPMIYREVYSLDLDFLLNQILENRLEKLIYTKPFYRFQRNYFHPFRFWKLTKTSISIGKPNKWRSYSSIIWNKTNSDEFRLFFGENVYSSDLSFYQTYKYLFSIRPMPMKCWQYCFSWYSYLFVIDWSVLPLHLVHIHNWTKTSNDLWLLIYAMYNTLSWKLKIWY
jgi:hypothetical protein